MLKGLLPADIVIQYTPTTPTSNASLSNNTTPSVTNSPDTTTIDSTVTPTPSVDKEAYEGLKTDDIRTLQSKLKELGYFTYDPDGLVNKRLIDAVYAFQFDQKIVSIATDPGAGYYGPITRTALDEVYKALLEKREKILALESQIQEARKINEEKVNAKKEELSKVIAKIPTLKV